MMYFGKKCIVQRILEESSAYDIENSNYKFKLGNGNSFQ